MVRGWAVAVVVLAGCGADPFVCSADGQCLEGGAQGMCQPSGVCSFDDDECDSGQRFGEHAGALANTCVPPGQGESTGAPVDPTTSTTSATSAVGDEASSSSGRDEGSSGASDDSTSTASSSESTGPVGLPDGSSCSEASECQSGHCFVIPSIGGVCGECTTDADCRFGCGIANPLVEPATPSTCDDGSLGSGCASNDACQNTLVCATVLDLPGVIAAGTCGTCGSEQGCPNGQVCDLVADYVLVQGQHDCVGEGSQMDGASCSLEYDGEAACANHCEPVSVMGLFEIGVCGECLTDADCNDPGGTTCVPGSFSFGALPVPSGCM